MKPPLHNLSEPAVALAQRAVTWAWPLYEMARMRAFTSPRRHEGESAGPSADSSLRWCNVLIHNRELMAAGTSRVVTPNVDTLFSNAWLDLRDGPLVIDVPDTAGRFYVLGMLDFYNNPFPGIGQRTTGTSAGSFLITPPGWRGEVPSSMQRIEAPTQWVWMIGRFLVTGPDDLPNVHALQDAVQLRRLPSEGGSARPVRKRFEGGFAGDELRDAAPSGARFAHVVNAALPENLPPAREHDMLVTFAGCGIGPGLTASNDQCELLDMALATELKVWHHADFAIAGPTGWQRPPLLIESFGENYAGRALMALKYIGGLDNRDSMYDMLHEDAEGVPLEGQRAYTLRFAPDSLPPVDAFWSLTLYDAESFMLAANPIKRYSIGDRTPGLRYDADGGLTIHIAHAVPSDPAVAANWLPAPEGRYYLCLRSYLPRQEVLSGIYLPPPLHAA